MITKEMREECTGCGSCEDICPQRCISLKYNDEGFRVPVVNDKVCIKCGLCVKKCPMNEDVYQLVDRIHKGRSYAAFSKDEKVREKSATGGAFFELASVFIRERGIVYGAVGNCLSGVTHVKAETIDELSAMQGSKYAQSSVSGIYKEIKEFLKLGEKVMFSGTPCQIAALYSVLGKDEPNLITVDLICHGVPSEKVLHQFIFEWEQKKGKKVKNYFRDKEAGWKPPHYAFVYEDGTKESFVSTEIPYNRGFIQNLYVRKVCTHCHFAKLPRIADITVGDWFGGKKGEELDPQNKGLSMIVANSEKGKKYISKISHRLFMKEYPLTEAVAESEHLAKSPKENVLRRLFFQNFEKYGFLNTAKFMVPNKIYYRVIRKIILLFIKG